MVAQEIIRSASELGVEFHIEGPNLIATPGGKLTDPLRAEIRQHKPDLIRLLTTGNTSTDITESLEKACQGLALKPQQLWRFLSLGDIADVGDGLIDFDTLRAYARRWSEHPHLVPVGNNRPYPQSTDKSDA